MTNRVKDNLFHFGPNEELVRALADAGVDFIVIGGLAVAWHCPERQADDLDLLIAPSAENSARVATALVGLQLRGFEVDSFARPGLRVSLKTSYYAELLTPDEDSPAFEEFEAQTVDAKLFSIPVRVASVSMLLAMKERAVRSEPAQSEKHLRDIDLLRRNL